MIRFLFDDRVWSIADGDADTTVLDWLRHDARSMGTKEGCASGDCGACTAVMVRLANSDDGLPLVYESFNTCITFVGALHGKQLLTVEHLATVDALHPVQQAMVEEHGSQCGFCTPGFVMSMFALYHAPAGTGDLDDAATGHVRIERALGGNLCRCTGYRPIVAAMQSAQKHHQPDQFTQAEAATAERLAALQQVAEHPRYLTPTTLQELASCIEAEPDARLVAGSTDLALEVTQQLKSLPVLISTNAIPEMQEVVVADSAISIGAAVSLNRCLDEVAPFYPTLYELLLRFGSEQVRNQGTLGGNIGTASPIGDLPPVLLALDASMTLQCGSQLRTVKVDDYFVDYRKTLLQANEFIVSVQIPRLQPRARFAIYKVSKRLDDDISAVCCVVHATFDGNVIESLRLGFGGMAAVPKRALATEQALVGQSLNDSTIAHAVQHLASDFTPLTDARGSAAYRLQVAGNLLRRFALEQQAESTVHVLQVGAVT